MKINITRTIWCPNPNFKGTQDVSDCMACELHESIDISGESLECGYVKPNVQEVMPDD